jgi:RimJ/RimL family protein N-acetyltransferase
MTVLAQPITLETERLRLRQWRFDDFEALAAFLGDDDANRYRLSGRGISREEAWAKFAEFAGQWMLRGYGEFAVEERATATLVGWCGLWHPVMLDEPEMVWSLFPAAQGKGYATEAAKTVMRWAAEDLGLGPLFSFVHPDNHPSRRLAERLGAQCERKVTFRGQPRLFYRHRLGGPDFQTNPSRSDEPRRMNLCQS